MRRFAAVRFTLTMLMASCVVHDEVPGAAPPPDPVGQGAYAGYPQVPLQGPPMYAAALVPAPAPASAHSFRSSVGDGSVYEPDPAGHPVEILRDDSPNRRYAAMDQATCEAELTRRGAPFARGEATAGVLAPVRLKGPMRGVSIHATLARADRERSPMEVFDCRLVLALDDFAALASTRGVVEMITYGAYRPRSAHGCTPKYDGLQHCGALAVDIGAFRRSDGTEWNVLKDFHGKIGSATCGPGAHPSLASPASTGLWSLVCDAAARGAFHVILTPNYNAEHKNHFHVEITPGADWMLIH